MMFKLVTTLTVVTVTNAFIPSSLAKQKLQNVVKFSTTEPQIVESGDKRNLSFKYSGALPPLNYFDPLKISSNLKDGGVKYLREAELHHSRVAMAAFPTLVVADHLQPGLAINDLYNTPILEQIPFWMGMTAYEFARMGNGWKNPFVEDKFFKLKESYQPGNLLNLNMNDVPTDLLNKELSNGRLAMIGTLGYLAQELVTHTKPF